MVPKNICIRITLHTPSEQRLGLIQCFNVSECVFCSSGMHLFDQNIVLLIYSLCGFILKCNLFSLMQSYIVTIISLVSHDPSQIILIC